MIPIAKPFFDKAEQEAIVEPLKSGWVAQGAKAVEFEKAFREHIGSPHASAVSSGTAALHLALLALGIGRGDEVITSPFTCIASINPIEFVGAKPIFVDIDLKTLNMNTEEIEKNITDRTKAIMPIHLFGLCSEMGAIMQVAHKHKLKVIEDAALALGAYHRGKHAGTFGDVGCFSFHPRKMITTGEGGMVVTSDPNIDERVKTLRNYGTPISSWDRHVGTFYDVRESEHIGLNYKMTDIQASVGLVQMRKLSMMLERRRKIAERYDESLGQLRWLITPSETTGNRHAYQSYVCLFNPKDAVFRKQRLEWAAKECKRLMEWMNEEGVATVQGAQSVHTVPYYKKKYRFDEKSFPHALAARMLSIALPIYPDLSESDQTYIVNCLKGFTVG